MLKAIALFIAIILLVLGAPLLFVEKGEIRDAASMEGMPWQIDKQPDGTTRVFGLVPGRSTLDDARTRFGSAPTVAMIAAPGESGSLEAFFDGVTVGTVMGKIILTLASSATERDQMLQRARKAEYMNSTTRKIELGDDDLRLAGGRAIAAITLVPSANLDEQIILQRFGTPAERIRSGENVEHFLYPDRGLELRLDLKGKEVLQYVAPAEFSRLRDPLLAPPEAKAP
jgi:hypothetical protein